MVQYRKKWFPALAALLWGIFLFLDITGLADSTWVKFASICLCCVTALTGAKTTDGRLVAVALCLTVGADWFLLVRDDHYELGIFLFLLVQFLYAYRLARWQDRKHSRWWLLARVDVALLLLFTGGIIFTFVRGFAFFAILPLFYFANLCINALEACKLRKCTFALSLLLFVCCDLCVGAYNLDLFPALTGIGMWFFYLPSQVLIVLSQETEKGDLYEKRV